MRVLIAPDKFKGTLSAPEAAEAMRRGVSAADPSAEIVCVPLADGGEGTVDVLATTRNARREALRVNSAEGGFVAPVARLDDGSSCIDVASTSGGAPARSASAATSRRTGEAVRALVEQRATRVLIGVGGSSSTDGGVGLARALGWRFLDQRGDDIAEGGAALVDLASIDGGDALRPGCEVLALCDVTNPLVGPSGAARTFAPQKGASQPEVEVLERGLVRFAEVVRRQLGVEVAASERTGSGGGIGAGLLAFLDARLLDGFEYVAAGVGLAAALEAADLVITGEGRMDRGSLAGKVTTGVARMARARGIPALAVCGEVTLDSAAVAAAGFREVVDASVAWGPEARTRSADAVAHATRVAIERVRS